MTRLDEFRAMNATQLEEVIRLKLLEARKAAEFPAAISFDGSPHVTWQPPADAIAEFAHMLGDAHLPKVRRALLDMLALARPATLPAAVVEDVIFAIGLLQAHGALLAAARLVLRSSAWGDQGTRLQAVLLMVLKGMRGCEDATLAAREMLAHPSFSRELVFDAMEVLVGSAELPLEDALDAGNAKMAMLVRPISRRKFERRLRGFVQEALMTRSTHDLAVAIGKICADSENLDTGRPRGLILKLLLCEPASPLVCESGQLRRKDGGGAVPAPRMSSEALKFLESVMPPSMRPSKPGRISYRVEWDIDEDPADYVAKRDLAEADAA